jgi:hypothetical protein
VRTAQMANTAAATSPAIVMKIIIEGSPTEHMVYVGARPAIHGSLWVNVCRENLTFPAAACLEVQ